MGACGFVANAYECTRMHMDAYWRPRTYSEYVKYVNMIDKYFICVTYIYIYIYIYIYVYSRVRQISQKWVFKPLATGGH